MQIQFNSLDNSNQPMLSYDETVKGLFRKPIQDIGDIVLEKETENLIIKIKNDIKYPTLENESSQTLRNILFSGPPRTAKTLTVEAIAKELNISFCKLDKGWILKYGDICTIPFLCQILKERLPVILLIDEIETVCNYMFIRELLQNINCKGLYVIGTTNFPNKLDGAMNRRFGCQISFQLPEKTRRKKMYALSFIKEAKRFTIEFNPSDDLLSQLAEESKGLSGGDIYDHTSFVFGQIRDTAIENLGNEILEDDAIREEMKKLLNETTNVHVAAEKLGLCILFT